MGRPGQHVRGNRIAEQNEHHNQQRLAQPGWIQRADTGQGKDRTQSRRLGPGLDPVVRVGHAHQSDPTEEQEGGAAHQQDARTGEIETVVAAQVRDEADFLDLLETAIARSR